MLTRVLALGALIPSPAWAFCGTYVGSPDAELLSGASQVVLAREGDRTVLTLANDVEGNVKDFALVLPIPEVVQADDVRVLDREVLDRVATYAGTRLVRYSCEDFADGGSSTMGCGCSERTILLDARGGEPSSSVTVEAEFAAGEYDIVVLSSEDSSDLLTWLNREGYAVSDAAADLLGEYIRGGSKFLAAKVRLADVPIADGPEGRPYLSPLQIAYQTEVFSLPIRLGTLNSPGSQDVVVYTLTSEAEGQTGIANYPEVELPNDCLFDPSLHGELDVYLDQEMSAAVDAEGGAAWVRTYTWSAASCDPCPDGGALTLEEAQQLGFSSGVPQLTRLWARYSPEAARQDLMLYAEGDYAPTFQLRYIAYARALESRFPVCGEAEIREDAGSCEDDDADEAGVPSHLALTALFGSVVVGCALRRRRSLAR